MTLHLATEVTPLPAQVRTLGVRARGQPRVGHHVPGVADEQDAPLVVEVAVVGGGDGAERSEHREEVVLDALPLGRPESTVRTATASPVVPAEMVSRAHCDLEVIIVPCAEGGVYSVI